jgi:hypothetical protein
LIEHGTQQSFAQTFSTGAAAPKAFNQEVVKARCSEEGVALADGAISF